MATRPAVLAGRWYPASESGARQEIEGILGKTPESGALAGIVPHAGWAYSGALAAQVLQILAVEAPELVLLFGTHMGPRTPAKISRVDAFETPLGPLRAATALARSLAEILGLSNDPVDGGEVDNTVEVQLPLIKYLMPEAELLVISPPASTEAITIGRAAAKSASATCKTLAVIGSTDLTHYGPNYGFSPEGQGKEAVEWVKATNDAAAMDRLLALDAEGLLDTAAQNHNACCPGAAAAAVAAARELGAQSATSVDYYTSYDVRPDASFVGYGGVVFNR